MRILYSFNNAPTVYPVKYGLLYNFPAATDVRKITSSDTWVVPTNANWNTLITRLGGATVTGGKLKETGFTYWLSPNTGATNEVNYNARGSGRRSGSNGSFINGQGSATPWFYCTIFDNQNSSKQITYNSASISTIFHGTPALGSCIRLMRTATAPEQLLADGTACDPYTGNDAKMYRTVKIGTQVWIADNLAEIKFRNGDYIHGYEGGTYTPISNTDWTALITAGVCLYGDNLANL